MNVCMNQPSDCVCGSVSACVQIEAGMEARGLAQRGTRGSERRAGVGVGQPEKQDATTLGSLPEIVCVRGLVAGEPIEDH